MKTACTDGRWSIVLGPESPCSSWECASQSWIKSCVKDKAAKLSADKGAITGTCCLRVSEIIWDNQGWIYLHVNDLGSIPGLGRPPGERKGYGLQYSGLENSMDCIVFGVAKSRTRLSDFHFHSLSNACHPHNHVFPTAMQHPGWLHKRSPWCPSETRFSPQACGGSSSRRHVSHIGWTHCSKGPHFCPLWNQLAVNIRLGC